MEDKNMTITFPLRKYNELLKSRIKLESARKAIREVREKDGRLLLNPKCVDLLLEIMEDENDGEFV